MLKGRVPGVEQLRLADMLVAAHCIGMKQHVADILGVGGGLVLSSCL